MTTVIALAVYSLCATLALLLARGKSSAEELGGKILSELETADIAKDKRLELMTEVARLYRESAPWYERSLSTIGVFAFLGMAVASAVQTVNANSASATVDRLRGELAAIQGEVAEAENVIAGVARGVLALGWAGQDLDDASRTLLRFRREQLREGSEEPGAVRERYEISLALGDFHSAVELLERNTDLLGSSNPTDLVAVAEYYFLTGAETRAKALAATARERGSDLPRTARLRLITLEDTLADPDAEGAARIRELAVLLRLNRDEARSMLRRRKRELLEGKKTVFEPR